jgi:AcrR family transcriptional regulator
VAREEARGLHHDRKARQHEMRNRILNATMKLFLKRGYDNVTMRNIASELRYSATTIYHYFKGKDEIFFALRGQGFELLYQSQLKARKSKDPIRKLRQHAQLYVDFALNNPEYYDLMFLMPAPVERVVERAEWAETVKTLDLLREDVHAAVHTGRVRERDPERIVLAFWSLLHGALTLIARQRLARHTTASDRRVAGQMIEFFFENLVVKEKHSNVRQTK